MLRLLKNPNINNIEAFFQDEKSCYLVLQMNTGGELFDRIQRRGKLPEKAAAKLMKQILSAVVAMHDDFIRQSISK